MNFGIHWSNPMKQWRESKWIQVIVWSLGTKISASNSSTVRAPSRFLSRLRKAWKSFQAFQTHSVKKSVIQIYYNSNQKLSQKRIKCVFKQSKIWSQNLVCFKHVSLSSSKGASFPEACVADSGLKLVTWVLNATSFPIDFGKEERRGKKRILKNGTILEHRPAWNMALRSSKAPALAPWTSQASTHGALAQSPFGTWTPRNGLMQRAHVKEQKKKAWKQFGVQRQIQN